MDPAADVYITFIKHVGALVEHGITRMEGRHFKEAGRLKDHSRQVIDRLKSPSAKVAIANAFAQLDPEIEEALIGELKFIIDNIQTVYDADTETLWYQSEIGDLEDKNADDYDADVASAAKTGKESLESILEKWIPKWLKNRLKILNEILSIVFKI